MNKNLVIAGNQLLKGNFGNAIAALATKSAGQSELVQPGRYRNGNFFFGVNGADKAFVWGNYNSALLAYQSCPVVSAIINRKAQCMVNGKRFVMDDSGKQATTTQAKQLMQLLMKPNAIQSGMQFEAQGNVYKQIYGYCPVLRIVPVGYENDFSKWKLWNLPPWMVQFLDNTDDFFFTDGQKPFKSIRLTYMGRSTEITDQSNIFILRENQIASSLFNSNAAAENTSLFLPDSKLFPIKDNINNFTSSLNSRGSLVMDRGPQWMLTNDANDSADSGLFPLPKGAKDDLQDQFRGYGIMRGQKKAIITDAKLKLQTVGFNVQELQLLEGEVQDAKAICDQLNYPPELLGLIDSKYDNQNIAERALYTNSIIPDSQSEDEQWGNFFQLEKYGLKLTTDFDHLPAMQENRADKGRGLFYMNSGLLIPWLQNLISYNEWRELMTMDKDPAMDGKFYSDLVRDGTITPASTAALIANAQAGLSMMQNDTSANQNSSNG